MTKENSGSEGAKIPSYLPEHAASTSKPQALEQLLLYQGLNYLWLGQSGLEVSLRVLAKQMEFLDRYPHHDQELDAGDWQEMSEFPFGNVLLPIKRAGRELAQSLSRIESAFGSVKGVYQGQTKAKTEDLLGKHLADAKAIVDSFALLEKEIPQAKTPSQIRVQALTMVTLEFEAVIGRLAELRSCISSEQVGRLLFEDLTALEQELTDIKSKVLECLDNPCQKMACKSQRYFLGVKSVNEKLAGLRARSLEKLTSLGVVLYNRAGRVN